MNYISADDFRVKGEKTILYATLAAISVLFLLLLGVSSGVILLNNLGKNQAGPVAGA